MTFKRREEIISKEVIRTSELAELMDCDKSTASDLITEIKEWFKEYGNGPRVTTKGKIHIQDYLDYYNISRRDFYGQITMDQRSD